MSNESNTTSTKQQNPKKANLLDHNSLKHILDESATEVVKNRGYVEDVRMSNVRLLMGTFIIAIALVAQFYPKKFPENKDFLIGCITLFFFAGSAELASLKQVIGGSPVFEALRFALTGYQPSLYGINDIVFNGLLQLIIYKKEKNAIMFTYPPSGSYNATGLVISSKLPRFSDMYTLTIESADPKSISAHKPVELTKSVTKWFTKDGVLVEGLFWKDVEGLVDDYNKEPKKKK